MAAFPSSPGVTNELGVPARIRSILSRSEGPQAPRAPSGRTAGAESAGFVRKLPRWTVAFAVLLMAVPFLPGTAGAMLGPQGVAAAPHGVVFASVAVPAHLSSHGVPLSLAGQSPSQNLPLNPAKFAPPIASMSLRHASTSPLSTPATHTAPLPARPTPSVVTGAVHGRVLDSVTFAAVSAALVEYSPLGARCPLANCSPVQTDSNGYFTFTSSPGFNIIIVTQSYYAQNTTWVDVVAGVTTNIGTMYLVHDAYASGIVETSDSAHVPVPQINVSSQSANGTEFAFPSLITNGQGKFSNLAVLPVPSIVNFAPTLTYSRYQGNFTWVSLRPYQHYDLGVIYMDSGVAVKATLVDSVHHKPLTLGLFAAGGACSTITGCIYQQGATTGQGGSSTVVYFDASPGPNRITFEADGYVVNITQFNLPNWPSNQVYNLGTIYMIPEGAVAATVHFTWSSQVAAAWAKWDTNALGATPLAVLSATSLDGLELGAPKCPPFGPCNETKTTTESGCGPIGSTIAIPATPLRVSMKIEADTGAVCNGMFATWPNTYMMPVFDNYTYANTTPGFITNVGSLDLTPGTFIQGTVTGGATGWGVQACSTDEIARTYDTCGPGAVASDTIVQIQYQQVAFYDPAGCPQSPTTFCVAAPVGPSELTFVGQVAVKNVTWVYVTPGVFPAHPELLSTVTANHISSVNLLQTSIKGLVLDAQTHKPIAGLAGLFEKPAGGAAYPSAAGQVNSSGTFFQNVTPGWDVVTISAPLYQPNSTWAEVNRSTLNIGTVNLTEDAYVHGYVVDPTGAGIALASVTYCTIAAPNTCQQLGIDGLTSTLGEYFGQVAPGLLPLGTYRILVSAPGYDENSTWVNATTPGVEFNATRLVLNPAGNSTAAPIRGATHTRSALSPSSQNVWVNGRVIDNATRRGLSGSVSLVANSPNGATIIVTRINSGGFYNLSLPPGAWWINASYAQFYYASSVFINVSASAAALQVTTLALTPYQWVLGRVVIEPWTSVTTVTGLGPGEGTARICNQVGSCGASGVLNSGGFFFVTADSGINSKVLVAAQGTGVGTAAGGFVANNTNFLNITNKSGASGLPVVGMWIFGAALGAVRDLSTQNSTPVRYGSASVFEVGPGNTPVTLTEELNSGGTFIMFLPQTNNTTLRASGLAYKLASSSNGTYMPPGGISILPTVSLEHFGWVVVTVLDSSGTGTGDGVGRARVGLAQLTANVTTLSGLKYAYTNTADSFGLDNISAPAGSNVTVSVQAPDYSSVSVHVSVNQSATTFVNDSSLATPYSALGNVTLLGWSWLQGRVVDPVRGNLSLPDVNVVVTANSSVTNNGPVLTNGRGYYLSDVPLGTTVNVSTQLSGYQLNSTKFTILPGLVGNLNMNLTGMGIIAGYAYGYPGFHPVAGATVSVCPKGQPACGTPLATTNGSGIFWTIAPVGTDAVNVTDTNYVPSLPTYIKVKADSWNWIGGVNLTEFAYIFGTVRALPSGDLLANANVSLCFPNVFGTGPVGGCTETVTTNAQGAFFLPTAAGQFIIDANATFYNDTFLPISVLPGEYVPVGTIFIQEFGFETGLILGSDTSAPIPGSTIQACPAWSFGVCTAIRTADGTGRFSLSGAPGPYTLFAIAPNYQATYLATTFVSGVTVQLPPIYLIPTGTNLLYTVSGSVFATNGFPVAGAIVSAGTSFATATAADGSFALRVPWGTYTFTANAPGYLPASQVVIAHATVVNVTLTLAPSTYLLSGVVRDGLVPNQPVQGVTISESIGGAVTTIAQSDASGAYSVPLENGTHVLTAAPGSAVAITYTPVSFTVAINGGPVTHDVLLFPPVTQVYGLVVDAVSGLALANASVVGNGLTSEHIPSQFAISTSGTGTFQVTLYEGSYTVTASAKGYLTQKYAVTANGQPTQQLTLSLPPSPPPASSGSSTPFAGGTLALLGGVAAVAVAAMLLARRFAAAPSGRPATQTARKGA
ncbi:MAG: carboxypeptidase regulatory-like domain-containing protein [Thermoplasmata archaeon]|nr:carboxypeptidase regulatory-like domain-containing protein [Thermoplasmata archaeon]